MNAISGAFVRGQDLGQYISTTPYFKVSCAVGQKTETYYTLKYFMATKEMEITEDQVPGKGKLDFPRLIVDKKFQSAGKRGIRTWRQGQK